MGKRNTSLRGFTLIELLVVISSITLLVGILLLALGAARKAAEGARCLANTRSLGQAAAARFVDTGGEVLGPLETTWMQTLDDYVDGSIDEARICPIATEPDEDSKTNNYCYTGSADHARMTDGGYTLNVETWTFMSSYGLNGFFYTTKDVNKNGSG